MSVVSQLTQFGKKVLALTKTSEQHTSKIKGLEQRVLKLTKYVKELKNQLDREKEKNKHLEQMYELKFQQLKSEIDSRLKDYEIFLLKQDNQQLKNKSISPQDTKIDGNN